RHVAAEDKSRGRRDWRARAGQFRGRSIDFGRPLVPRYSVQCGDMAKQVFVCLSFFLAVGAEAACHTAGMYIGGKEKGDIDRGNRRAILPEALQRRKMRRADAKRGSQHGASGKLSGLAHPWLAGWAPQCQPEVNSKFALVASRKE